MKSGYLWTKKFFPLNEKLKITMHRYFSILNKLNASIGPIKTY